MADLDPTVRDDTAMVAWLREQVTADLRAAERWPSDQRAWRTVGKRWLRYDNGRDEDVGAIDVHNSPDMWDRIYVKRDLDGLSDHIARHSPADVIADCEAKLAIIDQYERIAGLWEFADSEEIERDYRLMNAEMDTIRLVVRHLAAGYRHRPGWQERWRP